MAKVQTSTIKFGLFGFYVLEILEFEFYPHKVYIPFALAAVPLCIFSVSLSCLFSLSNKIMTHNFPYVTSFSLCHVTLFYWTNKACVTSLCDKQNIISGGKIQILKFQCVRSKDPQTLGV